MMMTTQKKHTGIPFYNSIRPRIIGLSAGLISGVSILFLFFILNQFETLSIIQLEHQGILISNIIEAGIKSSAIDLNIKEIQQYIDRIVKTRTKNDMEINIIFLKETTSAIVASNNPDNIGEASAKEHAALLEALKKKESILIIDRDKGETGDHEETNPAHPDYYIPDAYRFLSITSPLADGPNRIGSINIKVSLQLLDKKIGNILMGITAAILFEVGLIILGMTYILNHQIIVPLWEIIRNIVNFGSKGLDGRLTITNPKNEFGILASEFNRMLERIQNLITQMHDMVDNIAHDLKSPISRIRIAAELTLTAPSSHENYVEMIANTIEECDNILSRIKTILFMSETEADTVRLPKEIITLSEIVKKACQFFQAVEDEKEISLSSEITPHSTISGNSGMIQRLIANLVGNALKYSYPKRECACVSIKQ